MLCTTRYHHHFAMPHSSPPKGGSIPQTVSRLPVEFLVADDAPGAE